jgi:16S rRNA (uracil1498-N3)-methyltransferase
VVEHADRATVGTFHAPGAWGATVRLDEAAAHHASVKRLVVGDAVRLTSGDGRRAVGTILELAKRVLVVEVDAGSVRAVSPPPHVELWAPVGDRERMLLLAEKAVELGATAWRPVLYRRSRSVSPRGEGEAFREKVRARMLGALEQCDSAWMPVLHAETPLDIALRDAAGVSGLLLDAGTPPVLALRAALRPPIAIALGPEGGLEPEERRQFIDAGWRAGSLGDNVLRFETAGIAALAIVRSLIL